MTRRRCARCGEEWLSGTEQCWKCGFDQSVIEPESASGLDQPGLRCPHCQTPLEASDRFCFECGMPNQVYAPPPAAPEAPDGAKSRRKFGLREIGLVVVALAVLIASVYSVRPMLDRDRTVAGALTLYQTGLTRVDGACAGSGEFDDLIHGGAVTIRDGDGDTIATGELERGAWQGPAACRFSFAVPDVPRTSRYSVEVAGRGRVEYTRGQLDDANWRLVLVAGDPPEL